MPIPCPVTSAVYPFIPIHLSVESLVPLCRVKGRFRHGQPHPGTLRSRMKHAVSSDNSFRVAVGTEIKINCCATSVGQTICNPVERRRVERTGT
jgi:hypothetical protein